MTRQFQVRSGRVRAVGVNPDRLPPVEAQGPLGKHRPFLQGLLLTVFTLGIYHFWWHYHTHHEITRFLRRRNLLQIVWFGYILTIVVILVFTFGIVLPEARDYQETHGRPPFTESPLSSEPTGSGPVLAQSTAPMPENSLLYGSHTGFTRFLAEVDLLTPFLSLLGIGLGLFAIHMVLQHRALYRLTDRDKAWGPNAAFFLFLYWGSWFLTDFFGGLLSVAMLLLAYFILQGSYNDLWEDIKDHTAETAPEAPLPTSPT